ncbi:MAG: helix-turn-helix transcriptional regulator [Candidatus Burarchaeum sp.]|nr:helix-turn-helix transcriptional regulator [Candidatus Burarchaeum sp.]MDO8340327.1 helix-turn-helix transcriptional regulator [Candidatus Burarchaeum sp.]
MKNRLKELRAKFNITQEELAQRAKVTRQTIIAIEAEKYSPSLELAFRLARILDTPIEEMFAYGG